MIITYVVMMIVEVVVVVVVVVRGHCPSDTISTSETKTFVYNIVTRPKECQLKAKKHI